jgi:hypothetical protein
MLFLHAYLNYPLVCVYTLSIYLYRGVFPLLLLLSLLRNTTYLAPTSHLGNIALIVGVCTVFVYGYTNTTPSLTTLPPFKGGHPIIT